MHSISRVLIVGAGWVGRQVAARLAARGIAVAIVDRDLGSAEQAIDWMRRHGDDDHAPLSLHGWPTHSPSTASDVPQAAQLPQPLPEWLNRVTPLNPLADLTPEGLAVWQPELALECVPEQLTLKKRVLRRLSELVDEDCIIASNSSYFVPSVLAAFVTRPRRFAHLHFHVPVLRQSVADVVGCPETEPEVIARLAELCRRIGQQPLVLRREHPGYVFNWLLQAVLKAALELVALDVVDAEDVDRSWTAVTGMAQGPFGMMDQIGLDVIEQVLSNARWAAPPEVNDQQLLSVLRPLIEQGRLGAKTGAGFYQYRHSGEESSKADR